MPALCSLYYIAINNGIIVDVIISILQVDMGDELNHNMTSCSSMAAHISETDLLNALSSLTDVERQSILNVMRRAECLNQQAEQRNRYVIDSCLLVCYSYSNKSVHNVISELK